MTTAPAKVGVALVNWNSNSLTAECVRSLRAGSVAPWKIVIVDNGSSNTTIGGVAPGQPDVDLCLNGMNLGFAKASNIGIARLLAAGADWIWILNNDTVVEHNCLETLLRQMTDDPAIGAASGKILYDEPSSMIWYAGGRLSRLRLSADHTGFRQTDAGQYDIQGDVTFLSGCCMFIRRSAIEAVGMFDENYFAYFEDTDWCIRASSRSVRLAYLPQAVIRHRVSASVRGNTAWNGTGTVPPAVHYYMARNHLLTIRKHGKNPVVFLSAILLYVLRTGYILLGLTVFGRREKLASLVRGVRDGLSAEIRNVTHA